MRKVNMAVSYASFTALFNYSPKERDEIELRVGDLVLVKKPVSPESLQDWLEGENQRTKERGQIPGPFLKEVNIEGFPATIHCNDHEFQKLAQSSPVCCAKCKDYIWGKNQKCYQCLECSKSFHLPCANDCDQCNTGERIEDECQYDSLVKVASFLCRTVLRDRYYEEFTNGQEETRQESPNDWSIEDVLFWMAAVNLFDYAIHFKQHRINGGSLLNIDETRLTNMGIADEFHRKMILVCVGELIGNSETRKTRKYPGMKVGQKDSINTHSFVLQTFTTMTWCHECGHILFGLVRQGFQCKKCELICHRKCTNYQILRVCPQIPQTETPTDPLYIPLLDNNSEPEIVKKCVGAVESNGLRTVGVYKKQPDDCASKYALRTALYQDAGDVDMKDEDWINPLCPSSVLLSYLNELPDPLLPSIFYDQLIEVAGLNERTSDLDKLFEKLPTVNAEVLTYILDHLNRVAAADNMSETEIAAVFGPIILRPSQEHLTKMAKNMEAHSKLIQLLMRRERKEEEIRNDMDKEDYAVICPPVPPRPRTSSEIPSIELKDCYWPGLGRKEAQDKLEGYRDGSFMLRDSKGCPGEYSLTVRKGKESKHIRINSSLGKYGFAEHYNHNSVPELIHFYRTHSLKQYNEDLDVMLLYPVSREDDVSGVKKATRILKQAGERFNEKSLRYEQLSEETLKCEQEMSALEEAVFAEKELIIFLEEQVKIHENFQREAAQTEREKLRVNYNLLADRLGEENRGLSCMEGKLLDKSEQRRGLEADMNLIRPDLWELQHKKEKYIKILEDNSALRPEELELLAGNTDFKIYEFPMTKEEETTNLSKEFWLFGALDRYTIQSHLKDTPDGTFLIRDSNQNRGMKAISILFNGAIKHCMVEEGPEGFGFAEGFKTHRTLLSLVQHYHRVSLQIHNSGLATTLRFPVRCIKPNIPPYSSFLV